MSIARVATRLTPPSKHQPVITYFFSGMVLHTSEYTGVRGKPENESTARLAREAADGLPAYDRGADGGTCSHGRWSYSNRRLVYQPCRFEKQKVCGRVEAGLF
jgi:hypothetical protein